MKLRRWTARLMALIMSIMVFANSPVKAQAAAVRETEGYQLVFDAEYYYNTYPDLQAAIGMEPEALFTHFVTSGILEGRNGCEDFNLRAYVQNNPDLMAAFGENYNAYCRHYVENGRTEGRKALLDEKSNVLGSYTTYYDTDEQRAVNVELAAARINNIVLQPGESFSFSSSVLPRTSANGYVPGPAFAGGVEVISVGGGICQVSSTLYVAMIRSLLPSTERYTHSLPVDYVPVGLDATIASNVKDLKFRNIYSSPLTVKATAQDGELIVSLELGNGK